MLATLPMWSFPLVYDDADWLREPWSVATAPFRAGLWLSDGLPWGPRLIVLLLHLLNGALVWRIAGLWLSETAALLTLTLFWLHPLPLQAVFYLTGGREVWLTALALLALTGGWPCGVLAFGAALAVKASALPLLVAIPMVWALRIGYGRLLAVVLLCVGLSTAGPWMVSGEALRIWAVSGWRYLAVIVWPDGFSLLHDWRVVPAMVGTALLVLTAVLGVWAWRTTRIGWWAWCWVVGLTLPRALISDAPPLTEAQTYLPFLAIWLAIGASLDAILKGPTWPKAWRLTSSILPSR